MENQTDLFSNTKWAKCAPSLEEYFLLISPPPIVKSLVVSFKQKLHHRIGLSKKNMDSVPHLTLFKFRTLSGKEKVVIGHAEKTLSAEQSFEVNVLGVDFYETGNLRHIILKVELIPALQQVFSLLKQEFCPGKSRKRFSPHITIASELSLKYFEKAQPYLKELNYTGSFTCRGIMLLWRKVVFPLGRYEKKYEVRLK